MSFRRTKIICSIGPSSMSYERMKELILLGMNVARINLSHGTLETHKKIIDTIKKLRVELNLPVSILLDTKGPEIRVGELKKEVIIEKGKKYRLVAKANKEDEIAIDPFYALSTLTVGTKILFNEGLIEGDIIALEKEALLVEMHQDGKIAFRGKINVPEGTLNLPVLTDQDKRDLRFAEDENIDWIAASFIRSAAHFLEIKNFLKKPIPILAKIENREGVENFDEIVEISDGIMVARGDLGVEVDLSLVPQLQKKMIAKTLERSKPVVIATQMLESMIKEPRPTRAEVSDVANAIYDFTSLVMLSAETASGKYPIEVLKQMDKIILATEKDIDYRSVFSHQAQNGFSDVSSSVAVAAVKTAYMADAKAIFVFSSSGFTARLISRFKPDKPILALTTSEKTYHQLALLWGVVPLLTASCKDADEAFLIIKKEAMERGFVKFGDLIVMTAGVPFGKKGSTNLMRIESIGAILVRGVYGYGSKMQAKAKIISLPEESKLQDCKNKILVLPRCDVSYAPMIAKAKGFILQNNIADVATENYALSLAQTHKIPLIIRADNATTLIDDDQFIEMDPEKGLVYLADS